MLQPSFTKEEKPPFEDNQYQSDDEGYESAGKTRYKLGPRLGTGVHSVVYRLDAEEGKHLVALKPVRIPLWRSSKNPLSMPPTERISFSKQTTYVLYKHKNTPYVYFLTSKGELLSFSCSNNFKVDSLFPSKTDELLFPTKKRITELVKILSKPGYKHQMNPIDLEEMRTKLAFHKDLHPSNNLGLFEMDNDAVMIMDYIPGRSCDELQLMSTLEYIELFLSVIEEFKKCHNACFLIKTNDPEPSKLLNKLKHKPAYVLTSTDKLYYLDKQSTITELLFTDIERLKTKFPVAPNIRKIAHRLDLRELFEQTGHRHSCRVYMDLRHDNIRCNYDIENALKINWRSYLLDGGSSVYEDTLLPEIFCFPPSADLVGTQIRYHQYAPESFSVRPTRVHADRSMDIYSLGDFMKTTILTLESPFDDLVRRCCDRNPLNRPTLEELEHHLLYQQLVYTTRSAIEDYPVDFSNKKTHEEIQKYRHELFKQLKDLVYNPTLLKKLNKFGHTLKTSSILFFYYDKITAILGEVAKRHMHLYDNKRLMSNPHVLFKQKTPRCKPTHRPSESKESPSLINP